MFVVFLAFLITTALAGGGPAGIVLYHRKGTEIFLLLADHQPPSKRGWGGFGGKHEKGETPAQTAARETEEETRGFFKRTELLEKIENQTPFVDGEFALFFLEIDYVPADRIAAFEIPADNKAYRERGPWAWFPLPEIMRHLERVPTPGTAASVNARLLPGNRSAKHYWPVWLRNMHRALNAGVLPWMKSSTSQAKTPEKSAMIPER